MRKSRTDVVLVDREGGESLFLAVAGQRDICIEHALEEMVGVPVTQSAAPTGSVEHGGCILADGLEHEKAPVVAPVHEALVHERLERVEVDAAHGVCRIGIETSGEDAQRREVGPL